MSNSNIAVITYLDTHEQIGYTDPTELERAIMIENYYGSPMSVQLNADAFNHKMPQFILNCDPPVPAKFI